MINRENSSIIITITGNCHFYLLTLIAFRKSLMNSYFSSAEWRNTLVCMVILKSEERKKEKKKMVSENGEIQ